MRTHPVLHPLLGLVLAATLLVACGGGSSDAGADDAGGVGTLRLGLQQLEFHFIEGFQLALGVDTADGEERTYSWEQLVLDQDLAWPDGVTEQDLEWWYAGVLELELPAGDVTVTSKLDVGMSAAGEPCSAGFEVPAGGSVEVRVRLEEPAMGCPVLAE